jgi:diaminohydroxyphosphoribosylaminopyrimidine deaminase/5-amino-6-(5-phosphoribosylamino)uracil reductase
MSESPEPSTDSLDQQFMRLALQLAKQGQGRVEPNPMVGCVIVHDGRAIGQGYHRKFGGHHAEVEALRSLNSPQDARGATAYVTLEPCCHQGKTPPCSQALIDAGLSRVVVAMSDPFAQVHGGGVQQLKDAGIEVSVGLLQAEAESLSAPYLKKVRTGLPWVVAKWAMTIDGKIATKSGQSQWITGETSRQSVHALRARVDAIIVGMGTVTADDPQITARLDESDVLRRATRVVFCRNRLPAVHSQLVQSAGSIPLLLVTGAKIDSGQLTKVRDSGVEIVSLATDDPIEMVQQGLADLGTKGMTNVMLEGGGELLGSFFAAQQIDECHVYIGPKAFGGSGALGPIAGRGIEQIGDAWTGKLLSLDQFDDDFRAIYRKL